MVIERVVPLLSQDAVAIRDHANILLFFSCELTPAQRGLLRTHLLAALGPGREDVMAVAVPDGATAEMAATPYYIPPQIVPLPYPRCPSDVASVSQGYGYGAHS